MPACALCLPPAKLVLRPCSSASPRGKSLEAAVPCLGGRGRPQIVQSCLRLVVSQCEEAHHGPMAPSANRGHSRAADQSTKLQHHEHLLNF